MTSWKSVNKNGPLPAPGTIAAERGLGPCWLWTGSTDHGGYGRRSGFGVHRYYYTIHHGPVPAGLQIDHLCRVRICVNPDHMEAVTPKENVLRGGAPTAINAAKTHCIRGHEFTDENTYRNAGKRSCIACRRIADSRRPSGGARAASRGQASRRGES